VLGHLGSLASSRRDYLTAYSYYERSLQLFKEIGDRKSMAMAINYLGNLAGREGNFPLCQRWLEESIGIHRELRDRRALAWALASLGNVHKLQNQYEEARVTATESLVIFEEIGDRRGASVSRIYLGDVASRMDDMALARTLYSESLSLSRDLKDKMIVALGLDGLALIGLAERKAHITVRLWGAAAALRKAIGDVSSSAYDSTKIEQARAALGDANFTSVWEGGASLTWEEAVVVALDEYQISWDGLP
jgi:tetratricopeptide (TPR) repeat protein